MRDYYVCLLKDLKFEKFGNIVRNAEQKDGQQVSWSRPIVGHFEERMADSDVALQRDGHHRVDRAL